MFLLSHWQLCDFGRTKENLPGSEPVIRRQSPRKGAVVRPSAHRPTSSAAHMLPPQQLSPSAPPNPDTIPSRFFHALKALTTQIFSPPQPQPSVQLCDTRLRPSLRRATPFCFAKDHLDESDSGLTTLRDATLVCFVIVHPQFPKHDSKPPNLPIEPHSTTPSLITPRLEAQGRSRMLSGGLEGQCQVIVAGRGPIFQSISTI